jgi:hypothetical protein
LRPVLVCGRSDDRAGLLRGKPVHAYSAAHERRRLEAILDGKAGGVNRLNPEKLHVQVAPGTTLEEPLAPRCYTLTHSDATGDLYLTIGADYDRKQISGWYTRLLRDEVLAEWRTGKNGPALHVHCHVSGGLVVGPARWRYEIFRQELPLVLEALRYGDRALFRAHPELDQAPVWVHFHAGRRDYDRLEQWGAPGDYR